jgi:hypothetical protein
MMEQSQQIDRHYASQEFQVSLEQLEGILQDQPDTSNKNSRKNFSSSISDILSKHTEIMDLAAFEDAVADIERYLEEKGKKLPNR